MTSTNYDLRLREINTEESLVDTNKSQDSAYEDIVSKRIALGDFTGAIQTASKIYTWANQDAAFLDIVHQAPDINLAETAADKMNIWANQDKAYLDVLRKRLSSGDFKQAIQTASKINIWANRDQAFYEILGKCDNIEEMELIASKTIIWANQDRIYRQIVEKRLSNQDVEGAIQTALKINTYTTQDAALFDIIKQSADLKAAESVIEIMNYHSNMKKAYQILVDKHISNGNENDATRIKDKIIKLDQSDKEAIAAINALVNVVAVVTLSSVIIMSFAALASSVTAFSTVLAQKLA